MVKYLLLATIICLIGCKDGNPNEYSTYSKLIHTIQLTETDACANVILTVVCNDHICDSHITSVKVNCTGSNVNVK